MLISIYLPFSDYRPLLVEGFSRLPKPNWPFPDTALGAHLRSVGPIRHRRKSGFEGWVGEDRLALGINALAIELPRPKKSDGLARLRLVRKACYFDGLTNGRFELLFSVEPEGETRATALAAANRVLNLGSKIAKQNFEGTLTTASNALAGLWANATIKHGQNSHEDLVRVGRPTCIVESDLFLRDERKLRREGRKESYAGPAVELAFTTNDHQAEILLIYNPIEGVRLGGQGSIFRSDARHLRTYTLRLLQDVESLSLLFSLPLESIDDDKIQNLVNEYTRRVSRSQNKLKRYEMGELVEYCYSAFNRLYPGRVESLRVQLQSSRIRPNIIRKMLQFLDISEASALTVGELHLGDNIQGDKVMSDKYENIKVSGQGVAIGTGAQASVENSSNTSMAGETVASSLTTLAQLVREQKQQTGTDTEAALIEAAAAKAEAGDETEAGRLLKKSADWVMDIAKSMGSSALASFLKSYLDI